MDPNANLKEMLELANEITNSVDIDDVDPIKAVRLADLVMAMHEWLGNGGFKPQAWGN